jgi:cytochrome o ubiquinol oxidase subunit 1
MFGKLTLDAVPYHEPIIVVTVAAIIIGGRPYWPDHLLR